MGKKCVYEPPDIGEVFGFLTITNNVLGIFPGSKTKKITCNCVCGKTHYVSWSNLKRGIVKSCGCKLKELAGQHSGRRNYCCKFCGTTDKTKFQKNRKTTCSKCLWEHDLKEKQSKPEIKARRIKAATEKFQRNFKNFVGSMLTRCKTKKNHTGLKYEVDVDLEYLLDLLEKQNYQCALTKIKLGHRFRKLNSASLDRIDSKIGYIKGNVQFVCKGINLMKSYHTQTETIDFIKMIIASD